MKKILSLILLIFIMNNLSAQDKERLDANYLDEVTEEIWSLEEDYISYFKESNHNAILSFYHSEFLGWPDKESHPSNKKRAIQFLKENYSEPLQVDYQFNREGIKILGDIAITHYLVIFTWIGEDGVEKNSESRITHTWLNTDSHWKILGGMSNRK